MSVLYVYSRPGCHLCDVLLEELLPLVRGRIEVQVRDIDTREEWRRRFTIRIPVVEFEGRIVCQYHLDREAIEAALGTPADEAH